MIMSENLTESADSLLNESNTYTYSTDNVEIIKVHFKNSLRAADQDLALVDKIWQVSDTNLTQVIFSSSEEHIVTSGTPLKLLEGYELELWSIDLNHTWTTLELSKNGSVVDTKKLALPQSTELSELYEESLQRDPVYWYDQGAALFDQGRWNESTEAFSRAIELNQSYEEAWFWKGKTLLFQCSLSYLNSCLTINDSIEAFSRAIELNQSDGTAWGYKGYILAGLGLDNSALEAYNKATAINKSDWGAWYGKAQSLFSLGEYDDCTEACDKALESLPYSMPYDMAGYQIDELRSNAFYAKGVNLKGKGRNSDAKAAFANVDWMPKWMEFITFTKGQGLDGLLILHDKEDYVTSCNGTLRIEVYEDREYQEKLWSKSFDIDKEDFGTHTWTFFGAEQKAKSWELDRISYDDIQYGAEDPTWYVRAYFDSPDGSVLRDTTMI